jgi:hypothetical protein
MCGVHEKIKGIFGILKLKNGRHLKVKEFHRKDNKRGKLKRVTKKFSSETNKQALKQGIVK